MFALLCAWRALRLATVVAGAPLARTQWLQMPPCAGSNLISDQAFSFSARRGDRPLDRLISRLLPRPAGQRRDFPKPSPSTLEVGANGWRKLQTPPVADPLQMLSRIVMKVRSSATAAVRALFFWENKECRGERPLPKITSSPFR